VRNDLRRLREQHSWTQAQLADRLDVSRQTVNALETGRYDPSLPLAFRIAALFETSIEQLFTPDAADLGAEQPRARSASAS
jgi:putative transcriptional regulator